MEVDALRRGRGGGRAGSGELEADAPGQYKKADELAADALSWRWKRRAGDKEADESEADAASWRQTHRAKMRRQTSRSRMRQSGCRRAGPRREGRRVGGGCADHEKGRANSAGLEGED